MNAKTIGNKITKLRNEVTELEKQYNGIGLNAVG